MSLISQLHQAGELEVRKYRRVVITSTGYKSLWPVNGEYLSAEAAAVSVQGWLDETAIDAKWLEYVSELEQPTLF